MNYCEEFMKKLEENYDDIRSPEVLDFATKNMKLILSDFAKWKPMKVYKYMITFTCDPTKVDLTNAKKKDQIEKYIVKLLSKPEVSRFYYAREHDTTNTHWHCVVYRSSAFKSDYLTYYRKHFGSVDISRSKNTEDKFTRDYLSKESEIISVIS